MEELIAAAILIIYFIYRDFKNRKPRITGGMIDSYHLAQWYDNRMNS